MEDLTLRSDLFNNIKFNMQKLILDVPEDDAVWLGHIFGESKEAVKQVIDDCKNVVKSQAEKLKKEIDIPHIENGKTIAFIGDSITSDRCSYLNILRELYKECEDVSFVDAAISGDKSDDAVMKFYIRCMNFKPDVVHILIGTNDLRHNDDKNGMSALSLHDYRRNLSYMIHVLKEAGIPVVVSQISPVINERLKKRFPEDNWKYVYDEIRELNKIVCEVAEESGAKVNAMEKIYAQYEAGELLLQDGLHLNEKGQYLLAKNVLESLREYL